METDNAAHVAIDDDSDVVIARQRGREIAERIGMSPSQQTMVATAISEVARNIVTYAGRGHVLISAVDGAGRAGIEVVADDEGPGIEDLEQALTDGFSTAGSLGLGLPGARRLMDDFDIASSDLGTRVTMRKWVLRRP